MFKSPSPIWHPMTQHGLLPPEIKIGRGEGAHLHTSDGRTLIDAISSWWVITHGHCHPEIVSAIQNQVEQLDQVIFAGFVHEPAEDLTHKLLQQSCAKHEFIFYSDSGSTAIEVALKMAVGYFENKGKARHRILALENGYHGDTFGAMAAGARGVFNKPYQSMLFDVDHVPVPIPGNEERSLEHLKALLEERGQDYAAFIFEPLVQGSAGMVVYESEMLKAMCDLCQQYGVLLIADEVMTGFGRTGSLFACNQAEVEPDLMALSKGLTGGVLPMGATLASRDIYMAFYDQDRSKQFFHSTSFTGNPLACSAALASLRVWDAENTSQKITAIEQSHLKFAKTLMATGHFDDVRVKGTILAADLTADEGDYLSAITPLLYEMSLERDILLRPIGNTIYILPPYCVLTDDLQKIYAAILDIATCLHCQTAAA